MDCQKASKGREPQEGECAKVAMGPTKTIFGSGHPRLIYYTSMKVPLEELNLPTIAHFVNGTYLYILAHT